MKSLKLFLTILVLIFISTSCSNYLKTGIAGSTDVSLNRNSDEYTIKRLKPIDMKGNALFGIPGFGENNRNKNKTGLIFKLNGVQIGRNMRIFPILTMVGLTVGYSSIFQNIIKNNKVTPYIDVANPPNGYTKQKNVFFNNNDFDFYPGYFSNRGPDFGKLRFGWALLLGVPFAGATNNFIWSGNATSGLTNQMYYRLVDENPDVDIFTNPKYNIDYKLGIFNQKATIHAEVMGATLILKENK